MPILINTTTDTGVLVGYHRARALSVDLLNSVATATVDSYPDEQALLEGKPLAWRWTLDVPMDALNGGGAILDELESALITAPSSPFLNGTTIQDNSMSLETLKVRKRAEITRARSSADAQGFNYQGKLVQTRPGDMDALLITDARMRKSWPETGWPGGWTVADNSVLEITSVTEWDAFYNAMYDAWVANFNKSQTLKAQIEAAASSDDLSAITW